ncbi:HpcH/HpaI aldolase/citrate lyase family protein [Herbiconiux sp. SYSU D00978]|uniref:HpcH/HpaI aldolase/citrate lyase family protein n=1 Tax=Herbiconiux sp. SYSU D00978 TaxID=2812562 RepID=UPI001A965044|nr:CoA ester lyase [Herbiconiux sp. SYSU D00978]
MTDTVTLPERRAIDPQIARSWLLVNAARADSLALATGPAADQLIVDLEDGVDPARKDEARERATEWLDRGHRAWVRINDRTSAFWSDDLAALQSADNLLGVVLAKTEAAEHVTETFDRLGGALPVIPLVESALGIEEATAIAKARGAFRLAFGSGDYRRDTGAAADDLAMAYPRSRLVVASRVGGLPGPIDGPTVGTGRPLLRAQTGVAVSLGMTGKLCLDPAQVPVIDEVICPTASDVAWAREFLADFAARGAVIRDGSDLPRLGRARKIERLAVAFGLTG